MKKTIPILLILLIVCAAVTLLPERADVSASSARAMCVMERDTGRVLNSQNMTQKLPMASTTKIVTAITVIENTPDLERIVKIPAEAVGVEGSSIYLQKDEELKIIDLLHGLMLQSGNDCAVALAIMTGQSVEGFAKMMNATAKKAGALDSNFVNPHGLHHDKHYTTAFDLARISCYAMKNPIFKQICGTKNYTAPWAGRNYPRKIHNKNKILFNYEGGTGIKTGFTKRAGRCLVASSERDGMEVVAVVLNCGPMFEECAALMTAAHRDYKMTDVSGRGERLTVIEVAKSKTTKVGLTTASELKYPLTNDESAKIRRVPIVPDKLHAPVRKNREAGDIEIYLSNRLLFTAKLYTMEEARSLTVFDRLKDILGE